MSMGSIAGGISTYGAMGLEIDDRDNAERHWERSLTCKKVAMCKLRRLHRNLDPVPLLRQ